MSGMKRFAEEVAEELGKSDITDPDVVILGTLRANRRPGEVEAQVWVAYHVRANGGITVMQKTYDVGHSMKCKWTAFLNDLNNHSDEGSWRVAEDSATRKAIEYPNDKVIRMTVFQLLTFNAMAVPGEQESGEYKSLGQCIQDGSHLTDCDDDGYCNYCGEQDSPVKEAPPTDARCPACGWVDVPMGGRCYNCGASLCVERQDLPDNNDEI